MAARGREDGGIKQIGDRFESKGKMEIHTNAESTLAGIGFTARHVTLAKAAVLVMPAQSLPSLL